MKAVPIEYIENRIQELDSRLAELEPLRTERRALVELLSHAVAVGNGTPAAAPANCVVEARDVNVGDDFDGLTRDELVLGPTKAVLELVTREPGLKQSEIVARLQDSIKSSSTNKYRTLQTTVSVLKRKGEIGENEAGGLVLVGDDMFEGNNQ